MRTPLLASILALGMLAPQAFGQDSGPQSFATGLIFEAASEYDALPGVPTARSFLPEILDLSSRFPPVQSQGTQASCVAWATGYAARSYYVATVDGRKISQRQNIPSPAYIYNSIKDTPGDCDEGTAIPDALRLLQTGAVSLRDFPYDENSCGRPTSRQKDTATDFRIDSFARVETNDLDKVKGELAQGNPVIIGMDTTDDFQQLSGTTIYSSPKGAVTGSHAVTLVGYDENRRAFRLINSWGTDWGDKGYGWISYDLFPKVARRGYVIRMPVSPNVPRPVEIVPTPEVKPRPVADLPQVTCGRLELKDSALSGFVGSQQELDAAKAYAAAAGISLAVDLRPWPQCEALLTLDQAIATPEAPVVLGPESRELRQGEPFTFDVVTPDYTGFLHVAYIQADGTVLNLIQSPAAALTQYPPRTRVTLGDGSNGLPKFSVSPPLGREMLIVISSPSPLFPRLLPATETERRFLSALREALVLHRAGGRTNLPGAAIVTVNTSK